MSLNSQPCQTRPTLIDTKSYDILLYPFTVNVNKCGGSCNTVVD